MSEHSYWNEVRELVRSGHEQRRPKHEIREQIVHLVNAAEAEDEDWAADTLTRWAISGADADYTRVFKDQNTVTYIRKDGTRMRKTVGYSRPMRSADSGEIIGRQLQAWWGMSRTAVAALVADQIEQSERLSDSIAALLQVLGAMDRHPECITAAEAWEADGRTLDEIELDVAA